MRLFIETDFAGSQPDVEAAARVPSDESFRRRPDMVHVFGSRGRHHRDRLRGLLRISQFRQPLFRWTPSGTAARYQWAFAVENPAPDLTGAEGLNFTPDFIARLKFQPGQKRGPALDTDHIQASLLVRQLRGEVPGQSGDALATTGIGGNISGVLVPRWDADDRIEVCRQRRVRDRTVYRRLELTRRTGCGLRPGAGQPSRAPRRKRYFGYEHAWSRVFTTAVTYGVVNVSNLDIQLDDAFHRTQRTSINLMWNPVPFVDIVVEYLAGTRVNKNGQRASSSQIQSGWTLKF